MAEPSQPPPGEAGPSDLIRRLEERRERHRQRSKPYRIAVVVAGFLITLAGLIMTGPVPGPGLLVIPIGLALRALEFAWAERLLERAVVYAEDARRKASEASRAQKVLSGLATAVAIAAVVAVVILYDIPYLPG